MAATGYLHPQSSMDSKEAAAAAAATLLSAGDALGLTAKAPPLTEPLASLPLPLTPVRTVSTGQLAALAASMFANTGPPQEAAPPPLATGEPAVSAALDAVYDDGGGLYGHDAVAQAIFTAQSGALPTKTMETTPPASPPPRSALLLTSNATRPSDAAVAPTSPHSQDRPPRSMPQLDAPTASTDLPPPPAAGAVAAALDGPVIVGTPAVRPIQSLPPSLLHGMPLGGYVPPPPPVQVASLLPTQAQYQPQELLNLPALQQPSVSAISGVAPFELPGLLDAGVAAAQHHHQDAAPQPQHAAPLPQQAVAGAGGYDLEAELAAIIEGDSGIPADLSGGAAGGGAAAAAPASPPHHPAGASVPEAKADAADDDSIDTACAAAAAQAAADALAAAAVTSRPRPALRNQHPGSSTHRGVTKHKRTGRFEAHFWDAGKQIYLGGFDEEEKAARAYDLMSLHCRGKADAKLNFSHDAYLGVADALATTSRDDMVALLRRHSKGFSRGSSKYRGVTRHKGGRWEARMGQFLGKKYMVRTRCFLARVAALDGRALRETALTL